MATEGRRAAGRIGATVAGGAGMLAHGASGLKSHLRKPSRTTCRVVCTAAALSGMGYGIDVWATLPPGPPPPLGKAHIVAASALIADGTGWDETVTLDVPYTGLTPEPVSVGIDRIVGWSTQDGQDNNGNSVNASTSRSSVSAKDITAGASIISVSGATRAGDAAVIGTMKRGEVETIVITYRVPLTETQRRASNEVGWTGGTFYDYLAPVTAYAVVTAGGDQVKTSSWTELGGH